MKRLRCVIFLVLAFLMMTVSGAVANTINSGDYIQLTKFNPLDNAGIMTYNVLPQGIGATPFTISTFCIEDNVYITPGQLYLIQDVSTTVGPNGTNNTGLYKTNVPLNGAVDYLFSRYTSGVYNGLLGTYAAQTDLQSVLWSLQGTGAPYSYSNGYLWDADLVTYNNSPWMQQKSWGTEVINIVYNGQDIQNQLYNPDPVPEPSTLLLLGFGVSVLVFARRGRKYN